MYGTAHPAAALESHDMTEGYRRPGWVAGRIVNPILTYAADHFGVPIAGVCVLSVRGRRTGIERQVVVNVVLVDGRRYVVAARGQTEWAHNLRRAGTGTLLLGARHEIVHAFEVPDGAKPPILREYLRRWRSIVGRFFDGAGPEASDAELRRIAPGYPVFRLSHR
jgi:hypothetical protein